jgi:hypothetical protein
MLTVIWGIDGFHVVDLITEQRSAFVQFPFPLLRLRRLILAWPNSHAIVEKFRCLFTIISIRHLTDVVSLSTLCDFPDTQDCTELAL